MFSQQPFTDYLLEKYAIDFTRATQHPFLASAGKGDLDAVTLTKWLRQDYLYAYGGYIKYASALLSRIPLPTSPLSPSTSSPHTLALAKAVPLLLFSLSNVNRETQFFVDTARSHGLELFSNQNGQMPKISTPTENGGGDSLLGEYEEVTRSYVDFLWGVGGTGSVEEGLVLLWGMEKAYLESWRYARAQMPEPFPQDTETQRALAKFIDNWTCDEFVGFVDDCKAVVDGLFAGGDGQGPGDKALRERCEEVFKRTLWLEQRFWPNLSEQ